MKTEVTDGGYVEQIRSESTRLLDAVCQHRGLIHSAAPCWSFVVGLKAHLDVGELLQLVVQPRNATSVIELVTSPRRLTPPQRARMSE
ncbi:unnamed protein product [Gadus morhua 'NCC']